MLDKDDFDDLFDQYKEKKNKMKKPTLKKVGTSTPDNLPLWSTVKDKTDLDKCMVCKMDIDDEDIVEACDKCENYFHYKHIREWLKIKGTCAYCKQ